MLTVRTVLGACAILAALLIMPALGMTLARRPVEAASGPALAASAINPERKAATETFVGVLLPTQMANLSAREELKVLELRAKRGQRVNRGDVIVSFDQRGHQHELAIADAQLNAALAEAAVARTAASAARKRLSRRGGTIDVAGQALALVSDEESAQAEFDSQTAGARTLSALAHIAEQQARVEQLRLTLSESELRAPFDGVVSSVNFEPGATAHAGEVVARVVGGPGLRARIAIPEESVGLLHARRARIIEDGKTFFANIDQVPPEPEPASRMFIIEGNVEQIDAVCGGTPGCPVLAGRPVRALLLMQ